MTASVHVRDLPYGDMGSMTTLQHMRSIVASSLHNPRVVETAHWIVRYCKPRDYVAQAIAIRDWLATAFRFIADPVGVELTRTPDYMLRQYSTQMYVTGDCDDAATLGCALAKAIGIPCKFVMIGFRSNGNYAHVYGVLCPSNGTVRRSVSIDVTRPAGSVAQIRRRKAVVV
jgi:hypothetical protein